MPDQPFFYFFEMQRAPEKLAPSHATFLIFPRRRPRAGSLQCAIAPLTLNHRLVLCFRSGNRLTRFFTESGYNLKATLRRRPSTFLRKVITPSGLRPMLPLTPDSCWASFRAVYRGPRFMGQPFGTSQRLPSRAVTSMTSILPFRTRNGTAPNCFGITTTLVLVQLAIMTRCRLRENYALCLRVARLARFSSGTCWRSP
jgi:hypothetical protein